MREKIECPECEGEGSRRVGKCGYHCDDCGGCEYDIDCIRCDGEGCIEDEA